MVNIRLKDGKLNVSVSKSGYETFNACIAILKSFRFRYNPSSYIWVGPYDCRERLVSALEDYDVVKVSITKTEEDALAEASREQTTEPTRRVPDFGLMNFGPIQGKHPYEDFQKKAIIRGLNTNRYCYFYGMGSGKSYIASAIIAHRLYRYHDCSKVLLVTTNIGVRNLYHELFKFIKGLDPTKVAVADKDNRLPFDDPTVDIVVTSYSSIRLICNAYKKKLRINSRLPRKPFLPIADWAGKGGKAMLILDESHNVANPSSQQTHYIAMHAGLFEYRYLFSGTPADKPEKQWQQFDIVDPWLVYNLSFTEWKDRMAYLGDRFSMYAIREWKKDELEKQNQRFLASYGEYFKTTDLVDLPDYNEKTIYVKMKPSHRRIYEAFVVSSLQEQGAVRDVVNRFPYMLLGADDPSLLRKHEDRFDAELTKMVESFKDRDLAKYDALEDIIDDNPGEKMIVWVIHPSTAERICSRFKALNPICITGAVDQKERFDLVEEFKKGDHRLLVANITTLNTSVTILEAHVSVYFERSYNYTEFSQSQNRNYRIGQDSDIYSYILVYDDSLDVLLNKNLQSKGKLVEGLCSKDFLSQEDWVRVFNCREGDTF